MQRGLKEGYIKGSSVEIEESLNAKRIESLIIDVKGEDETLRLNAKRIERPSQPSPQAQAHSVSMQRGLKG